MHGNVLCSGEHARLCSLMETEAAKSAMRSSSDWAGSHWLTGDQTRIQHFGFVSTCRRHRASMSRNASKAAVGHDAGAATPPGHGAGCRTEAVRSLLTRVRRSNPRGAGQHGARRPGHLIR